MIATCEEFAKKHQITFNSTKSKLLCFNACGAVTPHIKLNGQPVSVVHKDKHLGNYISDSIHDRHCYCRSKLVSQLTNGQFNSKCDDTRRTLVCTGLLGKQGNQHHITGYGNESQQCLQSETVN